MALAHIDGPVVVDMVVDPNALSLPSHTPAATVKGFTISLAKQVVSGNMDDVIETAEHNVRLLCRGAHRPQDDSPSSSAEVMFPGGAIATVWARQ